jgi:hypothetical protein
LSSDIGWAKILKPNFCLMLQMDKDNSKTLTSQLRKRQSMILQKVGSFCVFLMIVLSWGNLQAQDVILPGAGGCGAAPIAGTWTVPCGVTSIIVEVYGGGGGAGGGGGGSGGGL